MFDSCDRESYSVLVNVLVENRRSNVDVNFAQTVIIQKYRALFEKS